MWEAPSRDRRPAESSVAGHDALSGAPDDSRPRNPWPRLLAFGAVLLTLIVLTGTCLVSYARPPERELRHAITEFSPGVPKFVPITTFGADSNGRTYGAWITLTPEGRAVAVLSRGPESQCHVQWNGGTAAATQPTGAFIDPCAPARYTSNGAAIEGTAPRDLHAFPARIEGRVVVVNLMSITLGACRADSATDCSKQGAPVVRTVPSQGLPPEQAR